MGKRKRPPAYQRPFLWKRTAAARPLSSGARLHVRAARVTIARMLFMVIEHFRNGDPQPVRERFLRDGRMLPDGVLYHASWVDLAGARCFQLMEAPDARAIEAWTARWSDLVEFEIVPIVSSQEYWAKFGESLASECHQPPNERAV
jgi:hypothetical protein